MAALAGSPPEMLIDLQEELVDRYGVLPVETTTLFRIISLKKDLAALRISKLEQRRHSLVFTFQDDTPLTADILLRFLQKHSRRKNSLIAKLTPDSRLVLSGHLSSIEHIFETLSTTLDELTILTHASY